MSDLKALSLFSGAGGLDLGLERAGFAIVGCVEQDATCRQTLKSNRPAWRLFEPGDVHAHSGREILGKLRLKVGDLALLAGGPPCQPFSKSGQWRHGAPRRLGDPRASTLTAYLDIVDELLPETMILENVAGITATRRGVTSKYESLDLIRARLRRINRKHGTKYELVPLSLDAANYGVPQHRQRVFLFASREGEGLLEPHATHGAVARAANGRVAAEQFTRTWDAIGELDDPDFDPALRPMGTWADLLPSIPEGGNYLHHTPRGGGQPLFGWRTKYWSFLLKLAKSRPSWTLQAQAGPATGPFHWRSRRLTAREMARLQSFPDVWEIQGTISAVRRQLGNAVPPRLAEVVGLELRRQIFGERPRHRTSLVPPRRSDCPPPEPTGAVAPSFLKLRGEHEDHPGVGRGPGAARRQVEEQVAAR